VIRSLLRFGVFAVLPLSLMMLSACDATGAPAARVGDAEITHEQLEADVAAFRFLTGLSGTPCGTPVEGETQDAACVRFTLTNDLQEELAKAYADANGVSVSAEDVTGAIDRLQENVGGAEELDARLEAEGLTRADLQALAERLILFNLVREHVIDEGLDDETLQQLYEQSKPQFTSVEVRHILLDTQVEAEEVAAEATPENFARLARERSLDPGSASSGGNLGTYSESQFRTQFDPTFVDAALALEPGQISGVVQTQFGYHVIELVRRDVASFEEVRDQLVAQQGPSVFSDWILGQYDATDVDVNPRYGRLDPATGEVVPVRSTASS
jgi:parvulin-like peptidyl-prolyl isomerase